MNNDVEFEALLGRAFAQTQRETQLPVVFGGRVGSRPQFSITHVLGGCTAALSGLVIHSGQGIGGLALASGKVTTVPNYLASSQITHHYDAAVASERLRGIVAAPVLVGRQVRAVLYGAERSDTPLGPSRLGGMHRGAAELGCALAVAEATARQLQELETQTALAAARHPAAATERAREAYADLLQLARETSDSAMKQRLNAIAGRFARAEPGPAGELRRVSLSARETEVLALVALGCTNPEIGERLGVERETVKSYLRNGMHKLAAHSRTAAVTQARALGLLP